jgi:hypothetical protein
LILRKLFLLLFYPNFSFSGLGLSYHFLTCILLWLLCFMCRQLSTWYRKVSHLQKVHTSTKNILLIFSFLFLIFQFFWKYPVSNIVTEHMLQNFGTVITLGRYYFSPLLLLLSLTIKRKLWRRYMSKEEWPKNVLPIGQNHGCHLAVCIGKHTPRYSTAAFSFWPISNQKLYCH